MNQIYIHFTSKEDAKNIQETGELWSSSIIEGVFAIAKGGQYIPDVQQTKLGRAKNRNVAIYFITDDLPDYCYPEECVWRKSVLQISVIKITKAENAINDLNGSLPVVGKNSWQQRLLIPTKEMPNIESPPDYLLEKSSGSRKTLESLSVNEKIILIERGPFKRLVLFDQSKLVDYLTQKDELTFDNPSPIIGGIVFQKMPKERLWTTISIASEQGFGPLLYELAMSTVAPDWFSSDEPIRVSHEARTVWNKFCLRDDVEKVLKTKFRDKVSVSGDANDCKYSLYYQYRLKTPLNYKSYLAGAELVKDLGYQPTEFNEIIADLASSYFLNKYNLPD